MNSFGAQLAERLKSVEAQPSIAAYRPHDKQDHFHRDLRKKKLFIGGNRSGKTVGGASETVWWAKGEHPFRTVPKPPNQLRVVTTDLIEGLEQIVLPEIRRWMPPSLLKNGSWEDSYNKRQRLLTLSNKSFIEFMTYEQSLQQFAGTSRTAIWFDEEPPKEIWTECLARLIDQDGSWWITMTPVEGMTWVYDDLYTKAALDQSILVLEVDMLDNPHISPDAAEEYLGNLSKEERQIREHGRFVSRTGMVYAPHIRQIHILPHIEPKGSLLQFESMDHGYTNPTGWLWWQVNKDGDLFIYDEYYETERVVAENALAVIEQRQSHGLGPLYVVGDPSIEHVDPISGESIQIEYIKNGIPIIPGNNDVKTGVNRVISLLRGPPVGEEYYRKPKLFIAERCRILLWEARKLQFASWHLKKMRSERNRKEEILAKDNHLCDAMRYGALSRPERDDGEWYPEVEDPYESEGFRLDYSTGTFEYRLAPVSGLPKSDIPTDLSLGDEY